MNGFQRISDLHLQKKNRKEFNTKFVEEVPQKIKDTTIYIVGIKHPWLILFYCPCGCNNLIHLNILRDGDPCWNYILSKKGKISIYPSIKGKNGCKSHFFIYKSRTEFISHKLRDR